MLAYELELPASMKCHDVFHVSLFELYTRRGSGVVVPPPALLPSGATESELEKIIGHRVRDGHPEFGKVIRNPLAWPLRTLTMPVRS